MLTLRECLDFCELGDDEIVAIAEHEGVTEIVAAEIGSTLLETDEGVRQIKRILGEAIEKAKAQEHPRKARRLERALTHVSAPGSLEEGPRPK